MCRIQEVFAVFLMMSGLAMGQAVNQVPTDPAPTHPVQDALDSPPVLLKPIQQKSGLDLSLIDDVCRQNQRQTRVYRLQHAAVEEVAETINQWLQQKLKSKQASVNGFICNAPIIIVPQVQSNSLVVSTTEAFTHLDDLEEMVRELDRGPRMIQIDAVIKRTNDGRSEVLLAPTMLVLENTGASITVGDGDDQLTLELTARVIETGPETNQAKPRSAEKKSGVDSK